MVCGQEAVFFHFCFQFIDRCCVKTENKPLHPSNQCRPAQLRWQRQRPNANQFVLCHGCSWITRARSLNELRSLTRLLVSHLYCLRIIRHKRLNCKRIALYLLHTLFRLQFFSLSLCAPPYYSHSHIFYSDIEFILLFDCKYFCADDSCPTHYVIKNLSSQY